MSSIRRTDLLALSNLRNDGRKPHEIRRMRVQLGPVGTTTTPVSSNPQAAGGSALVEMGLTVALATVAGPLACIRRSDERPDRAVVDVSVRTSPFASTDRRVVNPGTDRRLVEMAQHLQRALEATILLHLYPKSRIVVAVVVLADDGGRLCAAINAASAALMDAGIPTKDVLCACSAGLAGTIDTPLVDLNRSEESTRHGSHPVNLPCAMLPQRGTLVLSQCEARLPSSEILDRVLEAAMAGCRAVFAVLQAAVLERAEALMGLRRGTGTITDAFAAAKQEEEDDDD